MPTEFTINFYLENWSSNQFKNIGSTGKIVWSARMKSPSYYYHYYSFEIQGSAVAEADMEINVEVLNGTRCLLKTQKLMFYEGHELKHCYNLQNTTAPSTSYAITGSVTVCYIEKAVVKDKNSIAKLPIPSPLLVSDLLHLLDNPDSFSDATLVCGDTKTPVHRVILSARSPVFTAMFMTQMQEGREGVVDIVDMEPDVLQAMLRYVYSGKTDHLTHSMAGDLLFGADKYQLKELKSVCVDQLKTGMAANNVFRSLVLGDLHDKSLKEYAVDFICKYKNFSHLEKTEEWQSLMKERASLAIEVTSTALKYMQDKCSCTNNNKVSTVKR